jgi:hypothetical protein
MLLFLLCNLTKKPCFWQKRSQKAPKRVCYNGEAGKTLLVIRCPTRNKKEKDSWTYKRKTYTSHRRTRNN